MPSRSSSAAPSAAVEPAGFRVVVDLRPLQQPERAPITARYLGNLLTAFAAEPVEGEDFVVLLQIGLPDPTAGLAGLPIAGRRLLPPTKMLRSAALTVDPFILRGASLAAGGGAAGTVYHVAGSSLPLASRLPLVATLLDLAPWELPHVYQSNPSAHFGERLRARILHDATVITGSQAVAERASRLLHLRPASLRVVPLAPGHAFAAVRAHARTLASNVAAERKLIGLPERYLLLAGRYDARADVPTFLDALAALSAQPRPEALPEGVAWPPAVLAAGAGPEDQVALARAAARRGLGEGLYFAPQLSEERLATLMAGARAVVRPAVSDATGMAAIDALACGTPVVASSVGALPEAVGAAGVLVEARDPRRMARALETVWTDDSLHAQLHRAALDQTKRRPDWAEVAALTRAVYAEVLAASD